MSIQNRVFHRCELPSTFVKEIKNKKNILIIMDEIQVAAKKGQTIYNTFQKAGLLDKSKLYENDIKILEYTATPDGTIYDLMKWTRASTKILAEVGDGYVSSYSLLSWGRVKQNKELCGNNEETRQNILEIKSDIDKYVLPLYHIIRTKNGQDQEKTIENFKKIFGTSHDFINYDQESEIEDINSLLVLKPKKHTFIFIKEMLRCAKTLKKEHIGILYERYGTNIDDTVIIQGLIGRNTGYDDNGMSICYTNIDSIIKYEELWKSNFENKKIKWRSKTTKIIKGFLSGKNTFNDPKHYGFSEESSESGESSKEPVIMKFGTQKQVKEYFEKELKGKKGTRGPNTVKPNEDGYYEATIRSNKQVYTCEEINSERKHGLTDTNYRCYPCYENVYNKDTLQWWLIFY